MKLWPTGARRLASTLRHHRLLALSTLAVAAAATVLGATLVGSSSTHPARVTAAGSSTTLPAGEAATSTTTESAHSSVTGIAAKPRPATTTVPHASAGPTTTSSLPVGDLTVSLQLNPSTIVQHETTKLSVHVSTSQAVGLLTIDYGDGALDNDANYDPGFKSCQPGNANRVADIGFHHAWRLAKTFHLVVVVNTCGDPLTGADQYQKTVRLDVPVGAGELSSNGPGPPGAGAGWAPDSSTAMEVLVQADLGDRDGYGRGLSLDWGDGTPPSTFERALSDCEDTNGQRYPDQLTDRNTFYDSGWQRHTYAAAGTYTITVQGTSTGCDGQSPQSASGTLKVTVPCIKQTQEGSPGYDCSAR